MAMPAYLPHVALFSPLILFRHDEVFAVDARQLLSALDPNTVGMVVIDPPANYSLDNTTTDDDAIEIPLLDQVTAFVEIAELVKKVLRPGGSCVTISEPRALAAWESAAAWAELQHMADLVVLWDKPARGETVKVKAASRRQTVKEVDLQSHFTGIKWHIKPGYRHSHNPLSALTSKSNVIVCRPVPIVDRHCPTQRPTELFNYLISLLTQNNDLIVDPFCGSGASLVAACMNERPFIGGDCNTAMCDIARVRASRYEHEESHLRPLKLWVRGKLVEIAS